jgi:hypothetical protein
MAKNVTTNWCIKLAYQIITTFFCPPQIQIKNVIYPEFGAATLGSNATGTSTETGFATSTTGLAGFGGEGFWIGIAGGEISVELTKSGVLCVSNF